MIYATLKTVHVLAIVVWIGGMVFAHFFLRPAVATLEAPVRLRLMHDVLGRFFQAVLVAALLLHAHPLRAFQKARPGRGCVRVGRRRRGTGADSHMGLDQPRRGCLGTDRDADALDGLSPKPSGDFSAPWAVPMRSADQAA